MQFKSPKQEKFFAAMRGDSKSNGLAKNLLSIPKMNPLPKIKKPKTRPTWDTTNWENMK